MGARTTYEDRLPEPQLAAACGRIGTRGSLPTMPSYVVIRTSAQHRDFVADELRQGRLRQGWGWEPSQDLRKLKSRIEAGESLPDWEQAAWRNRGLLELVAGDLIVMPNVPWYGVWSIAEVAGEPYAYEIPAAIGDLGHIVPVRPLLETEGSLAVVNPRNALVDARLRGTMRAMRRMWRIDWAGEAVNTLVKAIRAGVDLGEETEPGQIHAAFLDNVRRGAMSEVARQLDRFYRGAEFEALLVHLLGEIYGRDAIEHVAGPTEAGVDLIVTAREPLGVAFRVGIQAKRYRGIHHDTYALDQVQHALEQHRLHGLVVLTSAERLSSEFETQLRELQEKLHVDVQCWTLEELTRLVMEHVSRRAEGRAGVVDV